MLCVFFSYFSAPEGMRAGSIGFAHHFFFPPTFAGLTLCVFFPPTFAG